MGDAAGTARRRPRKAWIAGALGLAGVAGLASSAGADGAGSDGGAIARMLAEPYPLRPGPWSSDLATARSRPATAQSRPATAPSRPSPAAPPRTLPATPAPALSEAAAPVPPPVRVAAAPVAVTAPSTQAPGAVAAAAAPAAAAAAAVESGFALGRPWYVSGSAGLVIANDSANRGTIDLSAAHDPGVRFAASAGHAWTSGFRIEAELTYQSFDLDRVTVIGPGNLALVPGSQQADGTVTALGLFANAAYDLDTGSAWRPYVVGGTGAVLVGYDGWSSDQGEAIADDSNWRLGFQFGGGVSYVISERWSADLAYRFAFSLDPRLDDAAGDAFNGELATHNLSFGARYGF